MESSLDIYRHELALILYPVFVHMYLELVYNGHEEAAKKFVLEYGAMQETFYQVRLAFYSGNPYNIQIRKPSQYWTILWGSEYQTSSVFEWSKKIGCQMVRYSNAIWQPDH